jgi:hypothetical protein
VSQSGGGRVLGELVRRLLRRPGAQPRLEEVQRRQNVVKQRLVDLDPESVSKVLDERAAVRAPERRS